METTTVSIQGLTDQQLNSEFQRLVRIGNDTSLLAADMVPLVAAARSAWAELQQRNIFVSGHDYRRFLLKAGETEEAFRV